MNMVTLIGQSPHKKNQNTPWATRTHDRHAHARREDLTGSKPQDALVKRLRQSDHDISMMQTIMAMEQQQKISAGNSMMGVRAQRASASDTAC